MPKIELDPKTGLPIVDGQKYSARPAKSRQIDTIEEDDEDDEDDRRKLIRLFQVQHADMHICSDTRHCHTAEGRVEGGEKGSQAGCEGREAAAPRREKGDKGAVFLRDQAAGEAAIGEGEDQDAEVVIRRA